MTALVLEIVGYGILAPAGVSMVLASGLVRARQDILVASALVVATCGAFVAAALLLKLTPVWPRAAWQWVPHLALITGLAGLLTETVNGRVARGVLLCATALSAALVLVPDFPQLAPRRHFWVAGAACSLALLYTSVARLPDRLPGWLHTGLLMLTALAAAVLLILSGNMRLGHLCSLMAPAAAAGMLPAITRLPSLLRSAVPLQVTVTGGLLLNGYLYSFSEIPAASYLMIAVAPATGRIAELPQLAHRRAVVRAAAASAAALLVLGAALGVAVWMEGSSSGY